MAVVDEPFLVARVGPCVWWGLTGLFSCRQDDELMNIEQGFCVPFKKYSIENLNQRACGTPAETAKTLVRKKLQRVAPFERIPCASSGD